ncbi:uncharacterized protein A1O9_12574 [Exophiala aquamarina CBS 119918]|uniref:Uncharacterized protein n=1 Tax=Exophiala aquamarina CBS 119918 TaxID=1182545 RepID=A0A072P752_9EURO|nr:uncharacterized protein A1O9_12574 [Exophiala aquamarina CBS 119918]KEF51425.1 hypothetical protein A1O9_12574 [Exophiala aquamarina CBS 119918]
MPIGFPDPALVNQSLSLALLTEQHVHELTRATLREQIENNLRLQAELDHSNERIRKLQMRMKLMNDVPNNYSNTNFESGSTRVPDRNDSNKAVRVAVGQDNNEGTARGDGVNPYEDKGCLKPATAANGSAEVADAVNHLINDGPESELDDSKLFDLGILEGSALEGTLCSHARQTLRKHFVVDSHQETITATPVQQCSNKLIEVSPESISSESGPVAPRVNKLLSLFQVPSTSTNPGPESTTTMTSYDDIKNLRFYSFDNGNMTEGASKTNDEGNGSEDQDGLTDLKTPATTSATESPTFIGEIPAEFPGQPMWKIHKDNPIFHDNSEKERAKHFSGIPLDPSSQFYNHPVRYLPENGVKSEDTFRTVMIDHIPLGTCANEVLHIIRGGAVESIEMVGPIGKATDYMTARVVFILEDSAMAMAKLQDLEINRVKLYCWLVREPTYPRSGDMEEFVTGGLDATRILWINNLKPAQYTQIQGVIMGLGLGRQLIGLDWGWESRAVLEFTSIKAAVKAAKCILKHPVYADATISFDEDYTSKE